jgi:hypothetical protein
MKTTNFKNQEMELVIKQKIALRIGEIPKKYRKIYRKAVEDNNTTAAIKSFCLECVCWQKIEVINCSCPACPLYGVRPFLNLRQPAKKEL